MTLKKRPPAALSRLTDWPSLSCDGIKLIPSRFELWVGNRRVDVTRMPFAVLYILMNDAGYVYTTEEVFAVIDPDAPLRSDRAVSQHISHLRRRIRRVSAAAAASIQTVRRVGFKFDAVSPVKRGDQV